MNNAVFEKVMKNVKNHTDIKLVTTDKRRNQLFSEPNYHTTKYFSENFFEKACISRHVNTRYYQNINV